MGFEFLILVFFIGPKIKYFLFPLTRPTLKNGPTQISFHDLDFFFINQNLYLVIRGLFFITLLFFHTVLLQNSKLNTVLNIKVVMISLSYFGIHYPPSRMKKNIFTD